MSRAMETGGRMVLTVLCAAGAGLMQGCATTRRAGTAHEHAPVMQPGDGRAAEAHVQLLNMSFKPGGRGPHGEAVATRVAEDLAGRVLADGFTIAEGASDVLVALQAEVVEFDRIGNYYRHEGRLDAAVTMPNARREAGKRRFVERGDRKLGEQESLDETAAKLAGSTAEWLNTLTGNLGREIAVNDIVVRRRGLVAALSPEAGRSDADYARKFIRKVSALDGVLSCELVEQDYRKNEIRFRILYYRRNFPEGMLNRLVDFSELELKP